MWFYIRRRVVFMVAATCVLTTYFMFLHLVQEAVLSATRAERLRTLQAETADEVSSQRITSPRRRGIPTVTGYSLEMQFRSARQYMCDVRRPADQEILRNNGHWQRPSNTSLFLYSAYYDDRLKANDKVYPFVRVLAMSEGPLEGIHYCQIWLQGHIKPVVVESAVTEIWVDSWDPRTRNRAYRPYLLSCPLVFSDNSTRVTGVSVVGSRCSPPTTHLPISYADKEPKKNFAICVKGLDFSEDISTRLVEWIELNSILGADAFTLYRYHVHPNVERVLRHYEKEGLVEIIPLTLPGNQPNFALERTKFLRRSVWQKRRNELVPYNDCFYRHVRSSRFVIPLDVDEVIVPRMHDTWVAMMNAVNRDDPDLFSSHASISAQQVYFLESKRSNKRPSVNFNSVDSTDDDMPSYLYMLRHTDRTMNASKPGHGVKSFMVTNNCLTVFNHYALEPLQSGVRRDVLLPNRLAQLNHYRSECPLHDKRECPNYMTHTKKDKRLLSFRDKLEPRVRTVLLKLELL